MLRDIGNNGGYLKLGKTGLKGELAGVTQSGRSSRSSSLASDRSPTGSIGSIRGSIASTESRSVGPRLFYWEISGNVKIMNLPIFSV